MQRALPSTRKVKNADGAPRVEWLDECDYLADDLLRRRAIESTTPTRMMEAKEFLREMLKDGPLPASAILDKANERGLVGGTLERAIKDLRVVRYRKGKGHLWKLLMEEELMLQPFDFN